MNGQIDIFEAFHLDPPELWDCMKTCARANIYTDEFPLGGKRCRYGQQYYGTSGKDWYEKTIDGKLCSFCKFYKMKEG